MAKRRTSRQIARSKKNAAKAIAMNNPGGKSRYCERPVDPARSTVNPVAVRRHRAMLARYGVQTDAMGNPLAPPKQPEHQSKQYVVEG